MIRRIIHIDQEKCVGCGACASACHEGAIGMVEGKAMLLREDYCDGLGDCLPACPVDAIHFETREAPAYDEEAVQKAKAVRAQVVSSGCPGMRAMSMQRKPCSENADQQSELTQWPVQIKLMPVTAPYYAGREILVAADCTAYAYGNFHRDFIRDRVTLIGCTKLDEGDYAEKLMEIIRGNDITGITVVRMEVPCCGGLENAVRRAVMASGKVLPVKTVIITTDGQRREM